jgi:hypothetical protein
VLPYSRRKRLVFLGMTCNAWPPDSFIPKSEPKSPYASTAIPVDWNNKRVHFVGHGRRPDEHQSFLTAHQYPTEIRLSSTQASSAGAPIVKDMSLLLSGEVRL